LAECAFRHDTVSQLYDVYYSWQYSQTTADDVPGTPSTTPRPRRRRRRRRWYLGVDRHGIVRTFRVKSVQRRRHSDENEELEFHIPRRVMFFQRWINAGTQPSLLSNFPAGSISIVPPGWVSTPSPPLADAAVAVGRSDETYVRHKRRQRRRRRPKCSRLLTRCRQRRRQRRQNIRSKTSTTTTIDVSAVLSD